MKLMREDQRALLWLSKQKRPMWGGIYTHGNNGDCVVTALEERGLIEGVAYPHTVGKAMFTGGYRITPAGRAALSQTTGGKG